MDVAIYICGAIATILAVVVGIFLSLHLKSPIIWVVFFIIFFLSLGAALIAQKKVWDSESLKAQLEEQQRQSEKVDNLKIDLVNEMKKTMWEFFDRNREYIESTLSENNELAAISKNGQIVQLGKIDSSLVKIDLSSADIVFEEDLLVITIPEIISFLEKYPNKFRNFTVKIPKYVGAKSNFLNVSGLLMFLQILYEDKGYFIVGLGFTTYHPPRRKIHSKPLRNIH